MCLLAIVFIMMEIQSSRNLTFFRDSDYFRLLILFFIVYLQQKTNNKVDYVDWSQAGTTRIKTPLCFR